MKFDIYKNNKGFPTLGVEKEIDGSNHRWLFMPTDIVPKELEEDDEFLAKYSEVFTDEVKQNYTQYLESLKPSLEEQRKIDYRSKLYQINSEYEQAIAELSKGIPNTERETWGKQELEAKAYSLDSTSEIPFLKALADQRGIPLELLVQKVLEKSQLYSLAVGTYTGIRQSKEKELELEYSDIKD